jgi:hypothetical protein
VAVDGEPAEIPGKVKTALFGVTQEALTRAAKHVLAARQEPGRADQGRGGACAPARRPSGRRARRKRVPRLATRIDPYVIPRDPLRSARDAPDAALAGHCR